MQFPFVFRATGAQTLLRWIRIKNPFLFRKPYKALLRFLIETCFFHAENAAESAEIEVLKILKSMMESHKEVVNLVYISPFFFILLLPKKQPFGGFLY